MKEIRTSVMRFWVTEKERNKILRNQRMSGIVTIAAYLRKMAIDGYCIHLDLTDVQEMVRLLGIYGNNVNQYAKRANESGRVYRQDVEKLLGQQEEIRDMTRKILEKLSEIR